MADNFFKIRNGISLGSLASAPSNARNGDFYYDTSIQKFQGYQNGAWGDFGSGSGGINYIGNPDFEGAVTGWVAYADAAGTAPVNGTGGSPVTTITRSTSSPLRGVASGLITKDAANRQGEGVSYDFTIDPVDQATQLQVSFDYLASSGFVSGDLSDITAWVYDITNGVVIQLTPFTIQTEQGFNGHFKGTFQTASNSTSYRLILHIGTTNASAWTFKFDNIVVGPMTNILVTPIGDFLSTTITPSAGFGTTSQQEVWSRHVGDSQEFYGYFLAGTTAASVAYIDLPSGMQFDTSKIPAGNTNKVAVGEWYASQLSTTSYTGDSMGPMTVDPTDPTRIYFNRRGVNGLAIQENANTIFATTAGVVMRFTIPVLGFSSNTVLSKDAAVNTVVAQYERTSVQTISTNTLTIVDFNSKVADTSGNVTTGASWKFTASVQGWYEVQPTVFYAASATGARDIELYKNGVLDRYVALEGNPSASFGVMLVGSTKIFLLAGDYIDVRTVQSSGGNLNIDGATVTAHITISRLPNAETIIPSETVAISYGSTSGSTIGISASGPVPYNVKSYDTHGAFLTDTFTAPIPGKYHITATFLVSGGTPTARIYKNNTFLVQGTIGSASNTCAISATVQLFAGDTIKIRPDADSFTLAGIPEATYLMIERVGD